MMSDLTERLQRGIEALEDLQQERLETGDPQFGYEVEREIIETELRDLEADIRCDSPTVREELVRIRRRRKS